MRIPIIRKLRGEKRARLVYMTYVLSFPDGDQWVKQEEFMFQDLDLYLRNIMNMYAQSKAGTGYDWKLRAMALWKSGECWWKDYPFGRTEPGIEHLILIEDKKRPKHQLKWGSKKGVMEVVSGDESIFKKPGGK